MFRYVLVYYSCFNKKRSVLKLSKFNRKLSQLAYTLQGKVHEDLIALRQRIGQS